MSLQSSSELFYSIIRNVVTTKLKNITSENGMAPVSLSILAEQSDKIGKILPMMFGVRVLSDIITA